MQMGRLDWDRLKVFQSVAERGASGGLYDVILDVVPAAGGSQTYPGSTLAIVRRSSVPPELREQVTSGKVAYGYTLIRRDGGDNAPGLAVGSQPIAPDTFSIAGWRCNMSSIPWP